MKTTLTLHESFALMQSMPIYLRCSNRLDMEKAREIAGWFGAEANDYLEDFHYANSSATTRKTHADTRGNGLGLFLNAEALFAGYLYEYNRVSACESADAVRMES
jgi:hypothetical protein